MADLVLLPRAQRQPRGAMQGSRDRDLSIPLLGYRYFMVDIPPGGGFVKKIVRTALSCRTGALSPSQDSRRRCASTRRGSSRSRTGARDAVGRVARDLLRCCRILGRGGRAAKGLVCVVIEPPVRSELGHLPQRIEGVLDVGGAGRRASELECSVRCLHDVALARCRKPLDRSPHRAVLGTQL